MMHDNIEVFQGTDNAKQGKYAIIQSRWNEFFGNQLVTAALDFLMRNGVPAKHINVMRCPGAFEIPLLAKKAALSGKYDAIIALGAVIRGATPHFDYVAGSCVQGLSSVQLETMVPVAFGVLTVDNQEQAMERSGSKAGNKGMEAAAAAFEMVSVLKKIQH